MVCIQIMIRNTMSRSPSGMSIVRPIKAVIFPAPFHQFRIMPFEEVPQRTVVQPAAIRVADIGVVQFDRPAVFLHRLRPCAPRTPAFSQSGIRRNGNCSIIAHW